VERVLPSDEVKAKVAALTVGLASDCDSPEGDVDQLVRKNLSGASTLPFVGLVAYDGTWVAGFSGFKDAAGLLAVLEEAEKSPVLQASAATQKKIAGLATRAEKSAGKGDWKSVLKAGRDVMKMYGRCPERETLAGLVKQARDWAAGRFAEVERICRSGGDLAEARKVLGEVRKHFTGEPERDESDAGLKAIQRLATIVSVESRGSAPEGLREKAVAEHKDSRWARIFEKDEAAEAAAPEDAPGPGDIEEGDG